jgi:glycosyltransferase involved in cell wall biosynthesis
MKISLVVLVWDEIEALQNIWESIPFSLFDEVVFIDPGSTDGTIEFINGKGYSVHIQKKLGRGNAFVEGMNLVRNEHIIFFSGDGNEDAKDIPTMISFLNDGYDMVIAGRHLLPGAKSDDSDDPLLLRKCVPILFGLFAHMVWNTGVNDAVNGFRGFKKSSMKKMHLDAPKHEIELQSTIRAAKLNMKIKEFATVEGLRAGGVRKPTAGSFKIGFSQIYLLWRELWIGKSFIPSIKSEKE